MEKGKKKNLTVLLLHLGTAYCRKPPTQRPAECGRTELRKVSTLYPQGSQSQIRKEMLSISAVQHKYNVNNLYNSKLSSCYIKMVKSNR